GTLAGALCNGRSGSGAYLSIWARSRTRAMALDHLGQRIGLCVLDRGINIILLVRSQLRRLQQDLWFAWRSDRLHDLDLDLLHSDPSRCGNRRDAGAPRPRHSEIGTALSVARFLLIQPIAKNR